jgi:hypothetical protein
LLCPSCEGARLVVRARVATVIDAPRALDHVYVPSLSAKLESLVDETLSSYAPPDALEISTAIAAYRGGMPGAESFEGYSLEGRVELAHATLTRMTAGTEVILGGARIYAWPLLVLDAPHAQAVVLATPEGQLEALVDESPRTTE